MGLLVFPTCFFGITAKDVDIFVASISGGRSLSGIEDRIATDGGGYWYADIGDAALRTRERIMTWRAFKSAIGGVGPFIFPICDARHQPITRRLLVPHSDGTSFDDESLYSQGSAEVTAAADAPLRATRLTLDIAALGRPLIGGERFTIVHPNWGARCYQIGLIDGNEVQFLPPLREAVTAGTEIDFKNPRFVAHVDGQMSAPLSNPKFATGSVRIVEDMSGSYL